MTHNNLNGPVRGITFDFWRTLFRDAHSAERQQLRAKAFAEVSGRSEDEVGVALRSVNERFYEHHMTHKRTLTPHDALRMVCEELVVKLSDGDEQRLVGVFATAIVEHSPVPIDGALDAVRQAAERVPVGVVSDSGLSPGSSLQVLLDRNGFTPYFKTIVFSDEVGVSKPQALMFETAAKGMGLEPRELLHIGDLEWTDVAGAKAIGARAALFAGDNARHLGETEADFTFTSWDEFIRQLPALV